MKLQSMAVIFAIIVIPLTLILSAYIGIQIDTASRMQIYDTKLISATYDAVVAFQLNTTQNDKSTVADSLRRDVTAAINTFFTSLATGVGAPAASTSYVTAYVPAVMVTLYDGYYISSPIKTEHKEKNEDGREVLKTSYQHALKPYIQYAVKYKNNNNDIAVNYSLDNYISIYGYLNDGTYISRAGYLIADNVIDVDGKLFYKGIEITNEDAKNYYKEADRFTKWIKNEERIINTVQPRYAVKEDAKNEDEKSYPEFKNDSTKILDVTSSNDPENKLSEFNAHKREVMKISIQSSLNNAIYAYSEHSVVTHDFRMPILTEQDWDKLLSNVNIVTFMQGMPVGTKIYNNYSIVTSTENKQYIDKNMLFFTVKDNENEYYHKIDCPHLKKLVDNGNEIIGYKSIDLNKKIIKEDEAGEKLKDEEGNYIYEYEIKNLACYDCIVAAKYTNNIENIEDDVTKEKLTQVYYNTIAKERYNLKKVTEILERENK